MAPRPITTQCCIVGGGPAGMMAGLLLARAGVDVVVLEKHADFLRDFRGDTIHPSTLEVIHELGLIDAFDKLPHHKAPVLRGRVENFEFQAADFRHLPVHHRYIALTPQWNFLNLLAEQGRRYPGFRLLMKSAATELIEEQGWIVGLRAETQDGPVEIRASLVIGADGRHSVVRDKAGFTVDQLGAPMDVLWFSLSRKENDPAAPMGIFTAGRIFIMINRDDYWQCGFVIPKGSLEQIRAGGMTAFHEAILKLAPYARDRLGEIDSWDKVKLLTVAVDRLRQWHRPGVLCIGDAAHTMSPIGGVGINLAVQDAVAAANILAAPLRENRLANADLAAVQKRREFPARMTQRGQLMVQNNVVTPVLGGSAPLKPNVALRLFASLPILSRIPARLIGMGVRPEHVRTKEVATPAGAPSTTPQEIIARLGMTPHPEGGHYVETYRAPAPGGERAAVTAIYFLLQAGEVSHWHRVDAAEIWLHHAGAPLALSIFEEGAGEITLHLGSDLAAGQRPQAVVPPHAWQSARSQGDWTLVSCTVAPAFEFSHFELAPPGWSPAAAR
jgi:2-polyprenyl-6-methoxyphenol hydroxylase-like FAD-dependent oxidoreductase/predicted cupin superfamily sugar epimerase